MAVMRVLEADQCFLCGSKSNLVVLDSGHHSCSAHALWGEHLNHGLETARTIAGLKGLGYTDESIPKIRELSREIYFGEGVQTRSLGFCSSFIPETGPSEKRHFERLISGIHLNQGIGWGRLIQREVDLDKDAREIMMDKICAIGMATPPKTRRHQNHLANILGGTFGDDAKDSLVAQILQWRTPSEWFVDDQELILSFKVLKKIVEGLEQAEFTETGILVRGTSSQEYQIIPINRWPFYRVFIPKHVSGVCINPNTKGGYVGDILGGVVMGLLRDEATAEDIPLLQVFVPIREDATDSEEVSE